MKQNLISVRNAFQSLLDNCQIYGNAEDPFKNAMVQLNAIIEDFNDPVPVEPAPEVPTPQEQIVTAEELSGIHSDLAMIKAYIASIMPPPVIAAG